MYPDPAKHSNAEFEQFYNNSQEIDMEFLSKQFNSSGGIVNLVLQSPESVRAGYDASKTPNYQIQPLPFRPDDKFHEYRFDWTPDRVTFFVDGQFAYQMTDNLPSSPGRFFMNHWSNGDPLWSAGPPEVDTPMTVSYVKAYFNSTDTVRNESYKKQCSAFDAAKVCQIPEQKKAPNGDDAKTYFFSQDGEDKTPGQVTFHSSNSAPTLATSSAMWTVILVSLFSWAIL
jgi:beta-glucanase (GH16 family)